MITAMDEFTQNPWLQAPAEALLEAVRQVANAHVAAGIPVAIAVQKAIASFRRPMIELFCLAVEPEVMRSEAGKLIRKRMERDVDTILATMIETLSGAA